MNLSCEKTWTVWKLIHGFIQENKRLFAVYVVFLLLLPIQDIGMPHMFGKLIQSIQRKGNPIFPVAVIISIMVVMQVAYSLADWVEVKMYPSIQKYTRTKMMDHIIELQKTNYEELQLGQITTKLIKLPTAVYIFMDQWKNVFLPQAIVFAVAVIYFTFHDKVIGGTLLLLIIALVVTIYGTVRMCEGVSKERDQSYNAIYEEVDDVLRNVITVLNYDQRPQEMERLDTMHANYQQLCERSLKCALRVRYLFVPIILSYLIFFTVYSFHNVRKGRLELAAFVAMFIIMMQITGGLWRLIGMVKDMIVRWGIIQESMELFRKCPPRARPDTQVGEVVPGLLFQGVGYAYRDQETQRQRVVLDQFHLWIRPQEKVLMVGKIGSGKTTVLRLLMKYLEPAAGEIYLDGMPYYDLTPEYVRSRIGYIPQNPILFNRTIYENIAYGLPHVTRDQVRDVLYQLGVSELIDMASQGLDTDVGKFGSKLSGGQRQIIWIVRTMLQNPDVLVMDEPTSAIDEHTKESVQALLQRVMHGKTVIMVTHDPFLLGFADRVVELQHGTIVRDEKKKDR